MVDTELRKGKEALGFMGHWNLKLQPLGLVLLFFAGGGAHCVEYGILVLWPGVKHMPTALDAWSRNPWTTSKVPRLVVFSVCSPLSFCVISLSPCRLIFSTCWRAQLLNLTFTVSTTPGRLALFSFGRENSRGVQPGPPLALPGPWLLCAPSTLVAHALCYGPRACQPLPLPGLQDLSQQPVGVCCGALGFGRAGYRPSSSINSLTPPSHRALSLSPDVPWASTAPPDTDHRGAQKWGVSTVAPHGKMTAFSWGSPADSQPWPEKGLLVLG